MHIKKITFSILVLAIASFIFNGITVSALPHQIIKQGSKSLYGDELFKDSIKQTGTTYFNMHTVEYDSIPMAAFCAKFELEAPLSGKTLCENNWESEKIRASIGSIIHEFRQCKQGYNANENQYKQCYFLTSVAIHQFIHDKIDSKSIIPNPLNGAHITNNSNNPSFNGKTVKHFYNAGINTFNNYLSNLTIDVKKKNYKKVQNSNNQYQLSVDAETNTDITPAYKITKCENATIINESENIIQVNNNLNEAQCTVKVTATGPTYYYAEKYSYYANEKDCSGKITGQPLIPNKLSKKEITEEKEVTITIPPKDIKGKITFNTCTDETISNATITINNQTKKFSNSGVVNFTNLSIGEYEYTAVYGSETKKGIVKITRNKNNKTREIKFSNCTNQSPPPQSCQQDLDTTLQNFEQTDDYDNYKNELEKLYKDYKFSKLLNLEDPECKDEPDEPEFNMSCNKTSIIMKGIEFNDGIVCTAHIGLDSPIIGSQNEVKSGTMLWTSDDGNIITGSLTLNCSAPTSVILLTVGQIESLLPTINLKNDQADQVDLQLLKNIYDKKNNSIQSGISLRAGRNEPLNITYSYPYKYNSYIGSGKITKKTCNNCINVGYGIPLKLNDNSGHNKGIVKLKFEDNDYYKIPEQATKSVECPYNVIKYDYLERQIAYQLPFGNRTSTGSNWCNMNYQKNIQVENDGDEQVIQTIQPNDNGQDQNEIEIKEDDKTASCTTDAQNNIMIKTYINNRPNSDAKDRKYVMYSFTLTPDNLKNIREYNKSNKYNDYNTLNCDAKGICFSKFLTESFTGKYSTKSDGYCKETRTGNLCVPKTIER